MVVVVASNDKLNYKLKKFSYRVLKKDALDLPDQVWMKRTVSMTPEQLDAYMQMKRTALVQLKNETLTTTSVLVQLIRLHQIVCGHLPTDNGRVIGWANNRIKELLAILEEHGGKAIICANYRYDIKEIEKTLLKKYGPRSVVTYYGDTPEKMRQENIQNYGAKVTEVFKSYKAKPMVRGGKFNTLEGETYPRTVIWEFPSFEKAIACHNSKEYQDGWDLAKHTTVRNLQIVEAFNIE